MRFCVWLRQSGLFWIHRQLELQPCRSRFATYYYPLICCYFRGFAHVSWRSCETRTQSIFIIFRFYIFRNDEPGSIFTIYGDHNYHLKFIVFTSKFGHIYISHIFMKCCSIRRHIERVLIGFKRIDRWLNGDDLIAQQFIAEFRCCCFVLIARGEHSASCTTGAIRFVFHLYQFNLPRQIDVFVCSTRPWHIDKLRWMKPPPNRQVNKTFVNR